MLDLLVRDQELRDRLATAIAGVAALRAAHGTPQLDRPGVRTLVERETFNQLVGRGVGLAAMRTQPSHQALRQNPSQNSREQIILQPHVAQAGDRRGSGIGMEG